MTTKKAVVTFDDRRFTVYGEGKLLISVPAAVVRKKSASPAAVAFGTDALNMRADLPDGLMFSRPFSGNTIADMPGARAVLRYYFKKLFGYNRSVEIYVLVSSGIAETERSKIEQCFITGGYKNVFIIERPYLLAKIAEKKGVNFIVDIEEATVEAALCENGKLLQAHAIDVGLRDADIAVAEDLRTRYDFSSCPQDIKTSGERSFALTADSRIPLTTCFSLAKTDYTPVHVVGRDVISGEMKTKTIPAKEMLPFVKKPYEKAYELLSAILMSCDKQMVRSTLKKGVLYLGEGTKINFFREFMTEKTGLPVYVDANPFLQVKILYNLLSDTGFVSSCLGF